MFVPINMNKIYTYIKHLIVSAIFQDLGFG